MNTKIASLLTLGMLGTMVFAILATAAFVTGAIDLPTLLILTVVVNLLSWLFAPAVNDFIYRIFYKIRFCKENEFKDLSSELSVFVDRVCKENGIKVPKIGIIEDDNPTAFTYGSLPSNARLVFSHGIFVYLNQDEVEAVVAHEIGHIVHYDFVVMTIANTLVQILYELYVAFTKTKSSNGNGKNNNPLVLIGFISYIFYLVATYVLLLLSRAREYYADEFSAKTTGNPNSLSSALIKIAYGMVTLESDTKSRRLLESTRAIGIMDPHAAKGVGMVSHLSSEVGNVLAFDFVSPWANILELGSTHPLTGKRIKKMDDMAQASGKERAYDIPGIINRMTIDKKRLYSGFYLGAFVYFLPNIAVISGFIYSLLMGTFLYLFVFLGLAMIIKALYKFSHRAQKQTTLLELMSDVYASPIRGERVALEGKVVGRGEAGAYLSEDLMFQDKTGIIYLDFSSKFGSLGNMFFALKKVFKIVGADVHAEGWFFRGNYQMVSLSRIKSGEKTIKSYPALWSILGGFALILFGLL